MLRGLLLVGLLVALIAATVLPIYPRRKVRVTSLIKKIESYLGIEPGEVPRLSRTARAIDVDGEKVRFAMDIYYFKGDREIRLVIRELSFQIEISDGYNSPDVLVMRLEEFEAVRAELSMKYPDAEPLVQILS